MKLFSFLRPAAHIPRLEADESTITEAYTRFRYQNFIGIFIGYASYYLLRKNFALAIPHLTQQYGFTKAQLGLVLSAIPIAYGISKFIMGNLSDRSNPRYFIAVGLVISALINLTFGYVPGITASLMFMFVLMFANGWAQGMGAPPCYRTVAHWFSLRERGRVMSVWNIAHNLGAGLLGLASINIISAFGWKGIFYVPAVVVLFLTVIVVLLMRDTPQSVGLMPIEEYSKEYPKDSAAHGREEGGKQDDERELSGKEILFNHVLNNKYVWFLALANVFVYFVRYGVLDWAPAYMTEVRGLSLKLSGLPYFTYEGAGILGMLLCGYLSDKLFKGRRAPVSILSMVIVCSGVLSYWLSSSISVSYIALFFIGMFIYGPVMLVGVQILDIIPKKAVGTAIGFLGLFGYWGGNMTASVGFGYIVDILGWEGGFTILTASCIMAILFFALTLRIKSVHHHHNLASDKKS